MLSVSDVKITELPDSGTDHPMSLTPRSPRTASPREQAQRALQGTDANLSQAGSASTEWDHSQYQLLFDLLRIKLGAVWHFDYACTAVLTFQGNG